MVSVYGQRWELALQQSSQIRRKFEVQHSYTIEKFPINYEANQEIKIRTDLR